LKFGKLEMQIKSIFKFKELMSLKIEELVFMNQEVIWQLAARAKHI